MKKISIAIVVALLFIGCGGVNKLTVSGVLSKHNDKGNKYFTLKDEKTSKIYVINKASEILLNDKVGHKIKMKVKISQKDTDMQTITSCTKCHHSIKQF